MAEVKGLYHRRHPPLDPGNAPGAQASRPSPKPKPNQLKSLKSDNIAIQKALTAMGLDGGFPDSVGESKQKTGMRAF